MSPYPERPIVCLISSGQLTDEKFSKNHKTALRIIALACKTGISIIQIREKKLSAKNLSFLTRAAVNSARDTNTKIVVNERFDIALACEADGVHLPSNAMSVSVVREHVPKGFLIGASTHSVEDLAEAIEGGADFAVFGPVFKTPGKQTRRDRKTQRGLPEISLPPDPGCRGIDETNMGMVLDSKAAGLPAFDSERCRSVNSLADTINR